MTTSPCPICDDSVLNAIVSDGQPGYGCSSGHFWSAEIMAAEYPLTLVPGKSEGLLLTADGAWIVRHPRGSDDGWLLDLTGASNGDDWFLLNVRAKDALRPVFDTPQAAVQALRAALGRQVRQGQVWASKATKERFAVTRVDHFTDGPDGTVFVRSLDDPDQAFSPGDFRLNHTYVAEHQR